MTITAKPTCTGGPPDPPTEQQQEMSGPGIQDGLDDTFRKLTLTGTETKTTKETDAISRDTTPTEPSASGARRISKPQAPKKTDQTASATQSNHQQRYQPPHLRSRRKDQDFGLPKAAEQISPIALDPSAFDKSAIVSAPASQTQQYSQQQSKVRGRWKNIAPPGLEGGQTPQYGLKADTAEADEPMTSARFAPRTGRQPAHAGQALRRSARLAQQQELPKSGGLTRGSNFQISSLSPSPSPGPSPRLFLLQRPEPTAAYLAQASDEPQSLASPRSLLVILDLNGTLLVRKDRGSKFTARPRVSAFLKYLLANHKVMVWSSARPKNVKRMCDTLFRGEGLRQLARVWDRTHLRLTPEQYAEKVQVYKQLSWVWEDAAIQASARPGERWSQANTVLIDDTVEKAAGEPFNLLRIDEFEALPEQMELDVLGQVIEYLEDVRKHEDVSAYVKRKPFVYDALAAPLQRLSVEDDGDEDDGGVRLALA